jgi:hypothetical protein
MCLVIVRGVWLYESRIRQVQDDLVHDLVIVGLNHSRLLRAGRRHGLGGLQCVVGIYPRIFESSGRKLSKVRLRFICHDLIIRQLTLEFQSWRFGRNVWVLCRFL